MSFEYFGNTHIFALNEAMQWSYYYLGVSKKGGKPPKMDGL